MRVFVLISLISLSFSQAYATDIVSGDLRGEGCIPKHKNCQIVLKEIEEAKKVLTQLEAENGKIPVGEKRTYETYIADLLKIYNHAKSDEKINVKEELFYASQKAFGGDF